MIEILSHPPPMFMIYSICADRIFYTLQGKQPTILVTGMKTPTRWFVLRTVALMKRFVLRIIVTGRDNKLSFLSKGEDVAPMSQNNR